MRSFVKASSLILCLATVFSPPGKAYWSPITGMGYRRMEYLENQINGCAQCGWRS